MQPRFVIVPAVPIVKDSIQSSSPFYAPPTWGKFDIYDNQEKLRLKPSFSGRAAAEAACTRMNSDSGKPDSLFPLPRTNGPTALPD